MAYDFGVSVPRLRLRTHLFVFWAYQACYYPFATLLLRDVWGLQASAVALCQVLVTVSDTFSSPLFGYYADKHQSHRALHVTSIVVAAVMRALVVIVAWIAVPAIGGTAKATAVAALLVATAQATGGGGVSLGDTATMNVIERAGGVADDYGRERLWGAVGWAIAAPLVGLAMDACGRKPEDAFADDGVTVIPRVHPGLDDVKCVVPWPYVPVTLGLVCALLAAAMSAVWLPHGRVVGTTVSRELKTRDDTKQQRGEMEDDADVDVEESERLLDSPVDDVNDDLDKSNLVARTRAALRSMFGTCVSVCLASCFMAAQDIYFFLFIDDDGGSTLLCGLAMTLTCCAEVPIFAVAKHLRKTYFPSALDVFRVVFLCYSIRFFGYFLLPSLPSPWFVLPIQLLHGITFGLYYATATATFREASPPGAEASMMGYLSGIGALGRIVGMSLGGVLYSVQFAEFSMFRSNGRFMWFVLGMLSLLAAIVTSLRLRRS